MAHILPLLSLNGNLFLFLTIHPLPASFLNQFSCQTVAAGVLTWVIPVRTARSRYRFVLNAEWKIPLIRPASSFQYPCTYASCMGVSYSSRRMITFIIFLDALQKSFSGSHRTAFFVNKNSRKVIIHHTDKSLYFFILFICFHVCFQPNLHNPFRIFCFKFSKSCL